MIAVTSLVFSMGFWQPPPPPPDQHPVTAEPRRIPPPVLVTPGHDPDPIPHPPPGGHGSFGHGGSHFDAGVFPYGVTLASADPSGAILIDTMVVKMVAEERTRNVPVQGAGGQTEHRQEKYTYAKPVFYMQKTPLPPEAKVLRNGRVLSAEEKRSLTQPTPIFIGNAGSAPGQAFENVTRDALVAILPSHGMGSPAARAEFSPAVRKMLGAPMPSPTPSANGAPAAAPQPMDGRVTSTDAATGVLLVDFEQEFPVTVKKTAMRKQTRTVVVDGQQRQIEEDVPYEVMETELKKETKQIQWDPAQRHAFDPSGRPVPASEVGQRLKVGDEVLLFYGVQLPKLSGHSHAKLLLALGAAPRHGGGPTPGRAPPPAMPIDDGRTRPTPTPATGSIGLSEVEGEVLEQTNALRAQSNLPPLRVDPNLMKAARDHSANMARQGRLEHFLDGKGPHDRLRELGVAAFGTGENCAQGQRSGVEAVQTWSNSQGHRANMLNASYTHIGIGKVDGASGPYWTQVFARLQQ